MYFLTCYENSAIEIWKVLLWSNMFWDMKAFICTTRIDNIEFDHLYISWFGFKADSENTTELIVTVQDERGQIIKFDIAITSPLRLSSLATSFVLFQNFEIQLHVFHKILHQYKDRINIMCSIQFSLAILIKELLLKI